MRQALFDIGDLSRSLIGKTVGFVRISEPQKYRQNCEVACWFTEYESDLGDFDLILRQDYLYPHQLFAVATVPGTVIDNYNASLLCGVPVTKGTDERGKRGEMPVRCSWPEAGTDRTGIKGARFYIELDYLAAGIQWAENAMRHYGDSFDKWYKEYLENPRNEYNTSIKMVGHHGKHLHQYAKLMDDLLWQERFRTSNPSLEQARRELVAV